VDNIPHERLVERSIKQKWNQGLIAVNADLDPQVFVDKVNEMGHALGVKVESFIDYEQGKAYARANHGYPPKFEPHSLEGKRWGAAHLNRRISTAAWERLQELHGHQLVGHTR